MLERVGRFGDQSLVESPVQAVVLGSTVVQGVALPRLDHVQDR